MQAKEYIEFIKEHSQSQSADNSFIGVLMGTLTNYKFDGTHTIHQYMIEMIVTTTKLRSTGTKVSRSFFVRSITNALPFEYSPFQIYYNTIKDKWSTNKL